MFHQAIVYYTLPEIVFSGKSCSTELEQLYPLQDVTEGECTIDQYVLSHYPGEKDVLLGEAGHSLRGEGSSIVHYLGSKLLQEQKIPFRNMSLQLRYLGITSLPKALTLRWTAWPLLL